MSTTTLDNNKIDQIKSQVLHSVDETEAYLAVLKKNIFEYDEANNISETTSSYLIKAMEVTKESVEELKQLGKRLYQNPGEVSDELIVIVRKTALKLKESIDHLNEQAANYDEKYKKVSSGSEDDKDKIQEGVPSVVTRAQEKVYTAITGVTSIAQQVGEYVSGVVSGSPTTENPTTESKETTVVTNNN